MIPIFMKRNGFMVRADKGSGVQGKYVRLSDMLDHIGHFDHIQQHYNGHATCANCDLTNDDPSHLKHCWLGQFLARFGRGPTPKEGSDE